MTGTHINYYFICKRKLWLFSHSLQMEHEHENVSIGKTISENTYKREKHEVEITDELENLGIKIDFFDKQTNTIHEIKKSNSFEEAHNWQVLFYIHILKEKGIENVKGEIDYPKLRGKKEVILNTENEIKLQEILDNIKKIISKEEPVSVEEAKVRITVCKKCSYYELCYS